MILPKEFQVCAQNFLFCRFPPFTFFPIKLPCGNCLKYWRNSSWNSLQVQTTVPLWHCIRHRNSAHLYCIRQRNFALWYCIGGLQAERMFSRTQSSALRLQFNSQSTLGGSRWEPAGARRILNFGFWPHIHQIHQDPLHHHHNDHHH